MSELIGRARRRIGAALAPHPGRHTHRCAARVRPYACRVPHTPTPPPYPVPPRAALVRPYVLATERQRARTTPTRAGADLLADTGEEVPA
ncbi:hypothetical protein F4561_006233 [Lipingzhangella halophila]|uniref:Uncharacterized protein n=1 Tax=Lipingzhangella halophila TaxID=1783352 RepID=A0A7W7W6V3_9ACTN|nr:hypothetical protein [Lipingzhangella halophila]MBB4935339.1 hypothetical protein [Lipingzhangella halophila]